MRDLAPMLKLAGIALAGVAVVAVLIIFVIIPLFKGEPTEPVAEVTPSPSPSPTPVITGDISDRAEELTMTNKSVNDPFMFGNEVVFTTGDDSENAADITGLAIYDTATKQTTNVSGIKKKYGSLFEPTMNDKYIVYLDCRSEDGGAVCGYDRATGESFVIREYLYGKPKVSLSGKYAVWLQETTPTRDKLYIYDLETKESATIEEFFNTPMSVNVAYASEDQIIYVQPEGESMILDGSSASPNSQISIVPIQDNGSAQRVTHCPGTYVYGPMIDGDDIVFLNGPGSEDSSLMYISKKGGTFTAPKELAKDVLRYEIGDGFVAYTQKLAQDSEAVFIYYFKDGSSGRLSDENTRALLASVNGKDVLWYDIMGTLSDVADIVIHINVP